MPYTSIYDVIIHKDWNTTNDCIISCSLPLYDRGKSVYQGCVVRDILEKEGLDYMLEIICIMEEEV